MTGSSEASSPTPGARPPGAGTAAEGARGQSALRTPLSTVVLVIAAVVVSLAGIKISASILAPVLLALFLMICFRPMAASLERRHVPRPVTIVLSILVIYAVLGFLGFTVYVAVARFVRTVIQNPQGFEPIIAFVSDLAARFGASQADMNQLLSFIEPGRLVGVAQQLLSATASVTTALAFIAALVFFMAMDAANFTKRLQLVVRRRPAVASSIVELGRSTRNYFAVAASFGAIVAVLDWILLLILGVPDAWLWALLSFVTNFIPNVGFILGLVPPAVLALLTDSWQTAVIVAIGYTVINIVVQVLIQPMVVGDRVQLNTTLTFLALVVWTWLLGGLGAILAIPMTLLVRALFIDSRPALRWVRVLFSSGPPAGTGKKRRRDQHAKPGTVTPKAVDAH